MELHYTQSYPASADRVAELMRDEDFLADVAQHGGATRHRVTIDGNTTRLEMTLPAPSDVAKVIGASIDLVQTMTWGQPDATGVRRATFDVSVPRMPVTVKATGELRPQGDSAATATFDGDLKVNIPLVGKKVERQVEPFISQAFAGLERRAAAWLARG